MKVIELVLFIVTFVAAEENMEYRVALSSQIGPRNILSGHLVLTQNGLGNPVKIEGDIFWLPSPGWRKIVVHELNENTTNCDSLGPEVDPGSHPVVDCLRGQIYVAVNRKFTIITRWLTLEPNKPGTLIGRAIAFVQEQISDHNGTPHHRNVACGSVLTPAALERKIEYYNARIAHDPEFNLGHIWY